MTHPKFSKGTVRALFLVTSLIDYLLCECGRNVEPTYSFGNTICHKEKYGVDGNLAKILIRYDLICFVFICEEHLCMNYVCLSEVLRTRMQ
jgi:hypothetical protein